MNINSFSNKVYNVLSNVKLDKILSEISSIEIKNIDESKLQKFYKDLNNLYKKLEQIKDNNILIHGFIDKYNDELRQIKRFLLQLKDHRSRSIHDKIFKNILKIY